MTKSKSKNILLLIAALFLSVIVAFGTASFNAVGADSSETVTPPSVSDYFSGTAVDSASFDGDGLKFSVTDGDTLKFKNKLVISDFAMSVNMSEGVTATVKFASDSYYVNGNKNSDGGFDTTINNSINLTSLDNTLAVSVNNGTVSFNGNSVSGDYFKIKNIDNKAVASVSITFAVDSSAAENAWFKLCSVDQKNSDTSDAYKQSFALNAEGDDFASVALPRVAVQDSFYTRNLVDGTYKAIAEQECEFTVFTMTPYSVLGKVASSDLYITNVTEGVNLNKTKKPDGIAFGKLGDIEFSIGYKDGETEKTCEGFTVNVVKTDNDTSAPKYVFNQDAYDAFKAALVEQYKVTKDGGKTTSVPLGSTFEIPSMADLVCDDNTPYSELKYTVTYACQTKGTSNSMEFDLDEIGEYYFYVAFKDAAGNSMEEKDFFTTDDDDSNKVTLNNGKYCKFVFTFEIQDDADIEVSSAVKQGVGYKGVEYTASKFTVDASGCNLTYVLYYNSDVNASSDDEGWIIIPKASSVTDTEYKDENGYTYDMIQEIGYDGSLTFNPTKVGSYKIACTATSAVSARYAEAETVIRVESEPKVVKVDNHWLQNNVWSVVFLSIGTLCLIGIIVLLFIKPKEETDND